MLRLKRFMVKYIAFILCGIIFLLGQAFFDLSLPGLMSDIVDVGIQRQGIEDIAPQVIQPELFSVLSLYMNEEEFVAASDAYHLYSDLDPERQAEIERKFPDAASTNAMVLTAEDEHLQIANMAFAKAEYALTQTLSTLMQQSSPLQDNPQDTGEGETTYFDYNLFSLLIPSIISLPQEHFVEMSARAQETPENITTGISTVLNQAIYEAYGADSATTQTLYILKTGLLMLLLSVAQAFCAVVAGFCFARFGAGIARDLRFSLFQKVSLFSSAEMDRFSTSSLLTRTTNDITQVQLFFTMGLRLLVFAPIMGIGGVVLALQRSVTMSWVIGLGVILVLCVIGVLFFLAMPRFKVMQKLIDRLSQVARESLTGLMVVRAFNNQNFQQERFEEANQQFSKNNLFVSRSFAAMMPAMMFIMNVVSLLIVWVGAEQIAQSQLQVGDMMAYMQYAMQIIMSFLFIAFIFIMLPRAQVSAERIDEVLKTEISIQDPPNPKTLNDGPCTELRFDNVTFCYDNADEHALCEVSFVAKPGQTTAIIGATGAGKTTLVNLIPRFYDASEGSVQINGVDVRDLRVHELRQKIGYVPQKSLLFSGTIESNLRYGDENASEDVLQTASEIAQAAEFVEKMDDGMESELSQGGKNVSGGQRQRLAIARALVKKAPIYIFDDSFSALDFATDVRLRKALKPYTENSIVLVVAQRVSSIMNAEQIVVLEEGRIAGIGTHKQLLKSCLEYREIAESQLSKEELA